LFLANTASSVAGMLWFVTYSPFIFIYQLLDTIGFRAQIVSCLFSNAAMGLGVKIIIQKEASGEGDLELSKEKKKSHSFICRPSTFQFF
jgi:hypothetical protein